MSKVITNSVITYNEGKAVHISESGLYSLIFKSKLPAAKTSKKWVKSEVLLSVRKTGGYELQAIKNEMMLKDKAHQEELDKATKQLSIKDATIEEQDAALAIMNDDLHDRDNQIQAIQYENVALQAQRDVYHAQLQRCQDTIIQLRIRYVDHARDLIKDDIIIIVRKHTKPANDKYYALPYYVARIQRYKRHVKLRWFD